MNSANISNLNLFDFQYLMYRPLYWFGTGDKPTVNTSLSLANLPTVSGRTVTITLKPYMWSNGTQVTAQDVMFWLNMELAEPANYGAYTGFPTNVSDIKVVSPTTLTMVMNQPYSLTWFLYNDLSQVTPMPAAWDRTASGPSSCATTVSDCSAVYKYLDSQAKNMSGYVSSPLWSIVDGPWKLSAFNADGHVTFVPNKSYSGPVKPKLAAFQEVPFTTDAAEYDVLRSPSSGTKIDFGYLPDQDAPAKPANAAVGANPLSGYTLAPVYPWGIDYYALNFQSTVSDHAAIIKQLYFRQVMAYLMNQAAIVQGPLRGYGAVTVGPVAATPPTQWLSATGRQGDPFPYNPGKAKSLLASHGWTVVPGGTTTCTNPSLCGPGITSGTALNFRLRVRERRVLGLVGDGPVAVQRGTGRDQAEPGAQAVRRCDLASRRQLRGDQSPVQLGHGELGIRLVVLTRLPADRRGAVHVRGGRELRRLLQQDQRRDDQPDAHQLQPAVHVQLAGLPGAPGAGGVPAERRLHPVRDRQQPQGSPAAEPDAVHHPGVLVFRELIDLARRWPQSTRRDDFHMRIFDANWMQIEEYLRRDDRIVLPTGSTEQHGYLSLGTDAILAERVAAEAAEPLGIPVLPVLPFGMAPYFAAFPGSMSLRITTYIEVIRDLLDCLAAQGFRRIAIVNGHGGNAPVTGLLREWLCQPRRERVRVLFHSWYNAPQTAAAASQFDPDQMHGGWVENFPWTRLPGVDTPAEPRPVVPSDLVGLLGPEQVRAVAPDGVLGGAYARPDEDMQVVWAAGVAEVRALLENGWAQ